MLPVAVLTLAHFLKHFQSVRDSRIAVSIQRFDSNRGGGGGGGGGHDSPIRFKSWTGFGHSDFCCSLCLVIPWGSALEADPKSGQ